MAGVATEVRHSTAAAGDMAEADGSTTALTAAGADIHLIEVGVLVTTGTTTGTTNIRCRHLYRRLGGCHRRRRDLPDSTASHPLPLLRRNTEAEGTTTAMGTDPSKGGTMEEATLDRGRRRTRTDMVGTKEGRITTTGATIVAAVEEATGDRNGSLLSWELR